jgi:hypothetical protein
MNNFFEPNYDDIPSYKGQEHFEGILATLKRWYDDSDDRVRWVALDKDGILSMYDSLTGLPKDYRVVGKPLYFKDAIDAESEQGLQIMMRRLYGEVPYTEAELLRNLESEFANTAATNYAESTFSCHSAMLSIRFALDKLGKQTESPLLHKVVDEISLMISGIEDSEICNETGD